MKAALILTALAIAAQNPDPPAAVTGQAQAIGQTTATITGTVDPNGATTTYRVEYGTTTAYGLLTADQTAPAGSEPGQVEVPLERLTPATTYHYRLVATNAAGVSRGEDVNFRTAAPPAGPRLPSAATSSARDVGPRGARLTASVDPNGSATSARFEYGTTTSHGSRTTARGAGAGDRGVSVSATVGGLRPNTRYHFRVVATNAAGTVTGRDRSFVTQRQPTGASIIVTPSRVVWAGSVTVTGRLSGSAVGRAPVALERQDFPFTAGFTQVGRNASTSSNGSYRFVLAGIFVTTRLRVASRTRVAVSSAVATVSSALRVGTRVRSRGARRARIEGAIWPRVPNGRASLQKRSPTGWWTLVRRAPVSALDANRSRYRFSVRRGSRGRRAGVYRVVVLARDGGAHVPGRSREVRVRRRLRG